MIASALVNQRKRRCGRDIAPDTAWTADFHLPAAAITANGYGWAAS